MISPWIYVVMSIFLTMFYIFLLIATDGSALHVNSVCVLMTFILCAIVSTMFLIAIEGAINITYGT